MIERKDFHDNADLVQEVIHTFLDEYDKALRIMPIRTNHLCVA